MKQKTKTKETETKETETKETETETGKKKEKVIGFNLFETRFRYASYKDNNNIKQYYKVIDKDKNINTYKYIERIYIGRLASNVDCIKDLIKQEKIKADSIVYIYCIGNTCDIEKYTEKDNTRYVEQAKTINNIVFVYDKDNNILYCNKHNNTSDNEAVDFFVKETKAKQETIDLPYVEHKKQETIKDIKTLIEKASKQETEIDLQF